MLLALALFPCLLFSQQIEKQISYGSEKIGFYEYKPAAYNNDQSTKYPVIIFLHGIGERGNGTTELYKVRNIGIPKYIHDGEPMRFYKDGKWHTFIVLSPQCPTKYGMWPTNYVDAMIDYAEKNLRIDKNRIYLTGLSMGGGGTWKWISASEANANKVAAIATVCAPATLTNPCVIAKTKLPMWSFHATNDATVNVSVIHNAINSVVKCNPSIAPKKTVWNYGGHSIWDMAYDRGNNYQSPNLFEWFLGYTRNRENNNNQGNEKPQEIPVPKPSPGNSTLIANAGGNLVVHLPYNSALLMGTRSNDKSNWIKAFKWQKLSGPAGGDLQTPTKGDTRINNLVAGTYKYRLTVTNGKNQQATNDITVRVNRPPNVVTLGDQITTLPNRSVLLQAWPTKDPDGWIKAFQWVKISGPNNPTIATPTKASTRINNLAAGYYWFRVTATDNDGNSASQMMRVIVHDKVNANKAIIADDNPAIGENINTPSNQVALYPNPASSNLNFTLTNEKKGKTNIIIYDLSGRISQQFLFVKDELTMTKNLDISSLNKGIYSVAVMIDGQLITTSKLIKN